MKTIILWLSLVSAANAEPAWWTCPPLRSPHSQGMIADLEDHCASPAVYRDSDVTIYAHELTHGVNSDIRQRVNPATPEGVRAPFAAFYVLNNRCLVLHTPNCTLADVCKRCDWHGSLWWTMTGQQHGIAGGASLQNQPLWICDEMIAYTHGAMMGMIIHDHNVKYDVIHAREMSYYAHRLVRTIEELDPSYCDLDKLAAFISWNDDRIDSLGETL
jgi:hypothetical protein